MQFIKLIGDFMKKLVILLLLVCLFGCSNASANDKKVYAVYIDPGHGGFDGGSVGEDGTLEKDIALLISLKLRDYFLDLGFNVYMTRTTDASLNTDPKYAKRSDILNRVEMINKSDCDCYLSIHLNAFPNKNLYGAQTFYNPINDDNQKVALSIQDAFIKILGNTKRVAKSISDKYLVEHVNRVGCLVEVGFLSNNKELTNLKDEKYQDLVAYAIYVGVLEYLAR